MLESFLFYIAALFGITLGFLLLYLCVKVGLGTQHTTKRTLIVTIIVGLLILIKDFILK